MTSRSLNIFEETFPLKVPFRIARGVKREARLVRVEIEQGGKTGEGECCPYGRYGEDVKTVQAAIQTLGPEIEKGLSREDLQTRLPPGAARNALDCALWDIEAKLKGVAVSALIDMSAPEPFTTLRTLGIDTPPKMAEAAKTFAPGTPLKVKLDMQDVGTRLHAIRTTSPMSQIVVDANESWTPDFLEEYFPILKHLGVVLLEQPFPAGDDNALLELEHIIPVCADEACHIAADLPGLAGRYDVVNIKLDKAGGLTGALELFTHARRDGFGIMLGCMVSSSLSIAPLQLLCSDADFIDLDAPLFLKQDRAGGMAEVAATNKVELNAGWGRP
ncbi:MAG: N-acetyl-D-Glu racemase DgcA [Sphingomonadales bacterium]